MKRFRKIVTSGLVATSLAVSVPLTALAATSETPVWIGAPYKGSYMSHSRPGQHGGNQVAFDYYAAAGTTVKLYAAPKNSALNNKIRAYITETGVARVKPTETAATCGYYAVVEIRHNGNKIGQVKFAHLASAPAKGEIARWGGTVGKIAALPYGGKAGTCYQVNNKAGVHTHIELRSFGSRPACAQDYGAVVRNATNFIGYIGKYSKAPLSGNRCPSGI